jgi:hypothetical protein
MRNDLLVRWSQSIEAAAELKEAACLDPARELPLHVTRIDVTSQQETRFEDGLLADDLDELVKFHGSNLPLLASCCNQSSPSGPTPTP